MASKQQKLDDIVLMGDPVLKQVCEPVGEITDEVRALAARMTEDMYAAEGCGLAAPQVGVPIRMIVVDCEYGAGTRKNPYVLIDPEIVELGEKTEVGSEGCLSFPGVSVDVERPTRVVVHARNLDGDLMRYEAEDSLLARCLQHEIDHLNGVVMLDHLGPIAKIHATEQVKRAIAAGVQPGETD